MTGYADFAYWKVSPRGFADEVTYFRVPVQQVAEVEKHFEGYEDKHPGSCTGWTTDARSYQFGVAVEWADRAYVGF